MNSIDTGRILADGALYSAVLGVLIVASLAYNARLWMQDFPQAIRDAIPPLSGTERRQRAIFGLVFMVVTFGLPLWLSGRLEAQYGGTVPFTHMYLYMLGVLLLFNLFDAVVLDVLLIAILQPGFVRLPGAEAVANAALRDPRWHLTAFLKGVVICTVGAALLAGIATLL